MKKKNYKPAVQKHTQNHSFYYFNQCTYLSKSHQKLPLFSFLFHLSISHESLLIIPFNKQSINEIYKIESVCSQINTN